MPHFRINHSVRGHVVESIVLDVPTPAIACECAAQWLIAAGAGTLAGQITLIDLREVSEREAWSPITDSRRHWSRLS